MCRSNTLSQFEHLVSKSTLHSFTTFWISWIKHIPHVWNKRCLPNIYLPPVQPTDRQTEGQKGEQSPILSHLLILKNPDCNQNFKIHPNPFKAFWVLLFTNRQTNYIKHLGVLKWPSFKMLHSIWKKLAHNWRLRCTYILGLPAF